MATGKGEMKGYSVITSDDCKVGRVVGVEGDNLIVEHGTLFKSKHAVPLTFAHTDEAEQVVRVSVSKEIFEASPKLDDGSVDPTAIAQHYGLAGGFAAPETQGEGDLLPDDPGLSAEQQELRAGLTPAAQERVEIRKQASDPDPGVPSSPGATGGDRARDYG
jgi:hypothetical protein